MVDSNKPLRLIFSARDPAAAHAIRNLVDVACQNPAFAVCVVTTPPASEMLSDLSCECHFLSTPDSLGLERLKEDIRTLLEGFLPHAVVAGASGPDAGVDEILIACAKEKGIRSYVVQDFWGDINLSLGVYPDCFLVVDQLAASLTSGRVASETCIVGSIKHAEYGKLDVNLLREQRRFELGVADNHPVIGYFGMPLEGIQGYWRTLERFSDAIQDAPGPKTVLYRPHPKESASARERTKSILNSAETFVEDGCSSVENTLAACDLIVSCYSSCGIDSELLGRHLSADIRLSIFLLFDDELSDYYKKYTGLDDLPISTQKRALTVHNAEELPDLLEVFLAVSARTEFLSDGEALPAVGESVKLALDKIVWDCKAVN